MYQVLVTIELSQLCLSSHYLMTSLFYFILWLNESSVNTGWRQWLMTIKINQKYFTFPLHNGSVTDLIQVDLIHADDIIARKQINPF